jgi:hypothetical protein
VFYLITFISSIPAVLLLDPVLHHSNYIVSAGADTRVLLGCFLDLINAIACIGTAVTLFPVVKRQHEGAALGFVTARAFEAALSPASTLCFWATCCTAPAWCRASSPRWDSSALLCSSSL